MPGEAMQRRAELALKAIIALSIGLFGLVVGYTNIVDYASNWQFVQHVLAMDSFEPWFDGSAIKDRAITSEPVQRAVYALIIAGELVTGVLFGLAGLGLAACAISGGSPAFGKTMAVAGGTPASPLSGRSGSPCGRARGTGR